MASDGSQNNDMMETLKAMRSAFDALAAKVDSSSVAQHKMTKEFPDKLDTFASNFKKEVLGEVQSQVG